MRLNLIIPALILAGFLSGQSRKESYTYTNIEYFNPHEKKYDLPIPRQTIVTIDYLNYELQVTDTINKGLNVFTIVAKKDTANKLIFDCFDTVYQMPCNIYVTNSNTLHILEVNYTAENKFRCTSIVGKENSKFTALKPPDNFSGVWEIFENGVVTQKISYKTGIKEGRFYYFYASGKKRVGGQYHKGELNYSVVEYYESGGIKSVTNYEAGKLINQPTEYFEDGKIKHPGK